MNYSIIHNIISGFGVDWDSALGELRYYLVPTINLYNSRSYFNILFYVRRICRIIFIPKAFIMSKAISISEVSAHNTVDKGLYIIIGSNVYNMTDFIDEHPGGSKILKRVGGKDASKQFWKVSVKYSR